MIKIEGENGITLSCVLDKIQKEFNLKTRKEALRYVMQSLNSGFVYTAIKAIIRLKIAEEKVEATQQKIDEEIDGEHCCRFNADGMCEICGAVQIDSPLGRELYGGE